MDKSGMVTNAAFAELFQDFVMGYGFANHFTFLQALTALPPQTS